MALEEKVADKKFVVSEVVVCWYQTHYEKVLANGSYPLDICHECLPDKSNFNCPHYTSFPGNFSDYESARKYIQDSRERIKK